MAGTPTEIQISNRFESYDRYLSKEWEDFCNDQTRWDASLKALDGVKVSRVIDIGCGAGQEMLPFVSEGALGVGVDVMPDAGKMGKQLFAAEGLSDRAHFIRASGSKLPFPNGHFDLSICRVALSYMDNHHALAEIARVIRPGGRFLLKYATPAYYWTKFRSGIARAYPMSSVHAARVLYAGYVYQLTGRQRFDRLTAGGEIFQTESTLLREIEPLGMRVTGFLPDSNPETPSVVITKMSEPAASVPAI